MTRGVFQTCLPALLVSGCLLTLPACGAGESGVRDPRTSNGSTSSGVGGGTSTGGSTTSSSSSTSGGGAPVVVNENPGVPETPDACAESLPGEPLLRRLTNRELRNTHNAVFGDAALVSSTELPPDVQGSVRLTNDAGTLVMGSQMAEAILAKAEEIAGAVTDPAALSARLPCAAQADVACAIEFIDDYGSALFRRPLSEQERARYQALYESVSSRSDFNTGLKWTLVALIQSPHGVYRSELGEGGQLTPYEIASQLSYNYSGAPPSQDLLARAVNGDFADPEVRVAEAKNLLLSPGGREVVQQFFSEWLWLSQVGGVNRANAPENFATIRSKMLLETQRFIEQVLFTHQGSVMDLLTANYTVVDSDLSAYYGYSGGSGDLFAGGGNEVTRSTGLGVFAQGSVLTSMASVEITSPTRRGLLLLKRLYCEVPGLPEALDFDLTRSDVVGNTTRERLESSHLGSPCQSCHAQFDPLGFAFESFDHIGRFRTEEQTPNGSFPIDSVATVEKLDGQLVSGQEELVGLLAQDPEVLSCVSATLERYVYGSDGNCRAKEARGKVMAGQFSVLDFLADLAREPHFVSRQ